MFFQKGMPLLYCGQEWAATHTPTLFDTDPVDTSGAPVYEDLFKRLIAWKKDPLFADGVYSLAAHPHDILVATWTKGDRTALGVFSMKGSAAEVDVPVPDGSYPDWLTGQAVTVRDGRIVCDGTPILIKIG